MSQKKKVPCSRPVEDNQPERGEPEKERASWQEKLTQYLQTNNLNQSESRNHIIEIIFREQRHFSVPELIKTVHSHHPQIGSATIYRNIPVLLEAGIIKETLTDDQGQKVYEVADDDHHDHIVCLDCGRIFEFHDKVIEAAQDKISEKMHFTPVRHRHVIYAHCEYLKK